MESSLRITNNIDHKTSDTNVTDIRDNSNIFSRFNILNDDCLVNILSNLDPENLELCKRIDDRFLYIIENELRLSLKLLFAKECLYPQDFIKMPIDYLISIDSRLQQSSVIIDRKYLDTQQNIDHLKRKLFFSIEEKIAKTKELKFQVTKTINHSTQVSIACFSKDNRLFISADKNGIIKVFSFLDNNYKLVSELRHTDNSNDCEIFNILISPDNSYIITLSRSTYIMWYKYTEGCTQIKATKNVPETEIYFRNDSKRFIIFLNNTVYVFNLVKDKCIKILDTKCNELHTIFNARQGIFNQNIEDNIKGDSWLCFILQRYIVSSMCDRTKYDNYVDTNFKHEIDSMVYSKKTCMILTRSIINSIIYSNNMNLLYVSSRTQADTIFEYKNHQWQMKLKVTCRGTKYLSPDNKRIIATDNYSNQSTIWNISREKAYKEIVLDDTRLAKFSRDGQYIIVTNSNQQIAIWHLVNDSWEITTNIENVNNVIHDVYFSNHNCTIANLSGNTATILTATC